MAGSGPGRSSELGSAAVPVPGPADHVTGAGPEATVYIDLACPHCAAAWKRIRRLPLRLCVRHFPIASRRPRSPVLHAAAEAVAAQSEPAFWVYCDSLLSDRGRSDDPHLWRRVEALELDLDRFESDRRSERVLERVQRDFRSAIRAGVTGTPAAFSGGVQLRGGAADALAALAAEGRREDRSTA